MEMSDFKSDVRFGKKVEEFFVKVGTVRENMM